MDAKLICQTVGVALKHKLITKLITQMEWILLDESIKAI
jgi:hypothetical protein